MKGKTLAISTQNVRTKSGYDGGTIFSSMVALNAFATSGYAWENMVAWIIDETRFVKLKPLNAGTSPTHWESLYSSSTHRLGSGVPSGSLGTDSDTYTNTVNGSIYEKVTGAWILRFDLTAYINTIVASSTKTYVNNGCTFVSSGEGCTFTRVSPGVWTITVPLSVELISADIYSTAAQTPGANVTINILTSSTVYNQSMATLRLPLPPTGLNLGAGSGSLPANYPATTGAVNLQVFVQSVGNGDIQLLINNFNTASGLGTGATILKLKW